MANIEIRRDDPAAALRAAEMLLALARGHGMDMWIAVGHLFAGWARGRLFDPEAGAQELRRGQADYFNQGNKLGAPEYHGWLAELEVQTRGPDSALALIDQGLAIAKETGEHLTDPYLHRLRGDVLLRHDRAGSAAAEEAYRTAIAVAKEQGARSFGLQAALSLAKLYRSTARPADAHAILTPALGGFSPTPEMPEIAEAESLLAQLAQATAPARTGWLGDVTELGCRREAGKMPCRP